MTQTEARLSAAAFEALFAQCSNWGRWGDDDQRGTLNLITPEKTRAAAALVREGVSVSCALPINTTPDIDNPMPGTHLMLRAGDVTPDWPTHSTADYLAIAPHGLAHSHLDALCHVTWQGQIYNGRPAGQVTSMGALCNDITAGAHGIVTRGVLLDLAATRGVEWLEPGTALRPSDLEAAEAAAGVTVEPGDVLLVRTGRWKRRAALGAWSPWQDGMAGLHPEAAPWLRERGVAVIGFDGISDALPHAVEMDGLPIHTLTLVAMGLQLLDNHNFEELAEACALRQRYAFLLVIAPLRLEKGTASMVNPIAVF